MGAAANLFPAYTQADWRKAAEAALNGAGLETLMSETADGVRIEAVYPPAEGPRAVRPGGPWRVIARLDHAHADEANAQALDDLANGADGLQVVSSGALGAYGFGLRQFDSATLHKAFDRRAFRRRGEFRTRSRARRRRSGASFWRSDRTLGRKARGLRGRLRARSISRSRRAGASPLIGAIIRSPMSRPRSHCEARASQGRCWSLTRARSMRRAEVRRKSLPLRSRPRSACCGCLNRRVRRLATPAR